MVVSICCRCTYAVKETHAAMFLRTQHATSSDLRKSTPLLDANMIGYAVLADANKGIANAIGNEL